MNVVMALFQQWMIPSVRNSLTPFTNMDIAKATERLLKLAVSFSGWDSFIQLIFNHLCLVFVPRPSLLTLTPNGLLASRRLTSL